MCKIFSFHHYFRKFATQFGTAPSYLSITGLSIHEKPQANISCNSFWGVMQANIPIKIIWLRIHDPLKNADELFLVVTGDDDSYSSVCSSDLLSIVASPSLEVISLSQACRAVPLTAPTTNNFFSSLYFYRNLFADSPIIWLAVNMSVMLTDFDHLEILFYPLDHFNFPPGEML